MKTTMFLSLKSCTRSFNKQAEGILKDLKPLLIYIELAEMFASLVRKKSQRSFPESPAQWANVLG